MEIIPVLDLMHGKVVHAKQGDRSGYQPIHSTLCTGSYPSDIVEALLTLFPFQSCYIADLDAIQGCGNNLSSLHRIRDLFPRLEIWCDAGIGDVDTWEQFQRTSLGHPVIGSETLKELQLLGHIQALPETAYSILSLDYKQGQLLGSSTLFDCISNWPARVIAMTLSRVGTSLGPHFAQLHRLMQRSPKSRWYAAGGVRDIEDLAKLQSLNVSGALVASALHDGRLNGDDIATLGNNMSTGSDGYTGH